MSDIVDIDEGGANVKMTNGTIGFVRSMIQQTACSLRVGVSVCRRFLWNHISTLRQGVFPPFQPIQSAGAKK